MPEVVIVEAVRSAVGKRKGTLTHTESPDLLADVYAALFDRVALDPVLVGQVLTGCVGQVGQQSGNVGRTAWLSAGLPLTVPATTIQTQCGSSQQATTLAHGLVASGLVDIAVAAGVESMSQVPLGAANNDDYGVARNDRYANHYEVTSQFEGADRIAQKWGLTRTDLEAFALRSQQLAASAVADGRFDSQIVAIEAISVDEGGNRSGTVSFRRDEAPRESSLEGLAGLKTNLPDDGLHTAGTSSQIADGASALLLTTPEAAERLGLRPRARVVDSVLVGSDPELMLTGPIPATHTLLERTGLSVDDIDVFEVNEAFASVVLAWQREIGASLEKVNPNGGAIGLGHPLGATGGILLTKALNELERTSSRYGLVTMCCGGGVGTGTIIERLD
ncbi:acetyl-CoA C-acyltransferase [Nocardioides sp. WS12]|uniref:thiolase family protein n=1 Tax=Nocardioides sp. WS12 TaxID=2486272 RepID=UPI0015F9F2A9|nr:acetyl-CoA C-acyltransferase [Nocardioides sp. WS12]